MKITMLFETLYAKYYEPVFWFCFRFSNQRESALDITQETFVRLYERMNGTPEAIENPQAWLYKVAGNLSLNHLKNSSRHREIENTLDHSKVETATPENIFIHSEKVSRVKRCIEKLKPKEKMLILLYQQDLSYRELSVAAGIPEKSVGKTLWRIIHKLSKQLDDENGK